MPPERGKGLLESIVPLSPRPCQRPVPPPICQGPPPTAWGLLQERGEGGGGGGAQGFPSLCIFWISLGIAEVPPGAWPFEARPNRFFQPFRDIWQLLKEAAAPARLSSPPHLPQHLHTGTPRTPGWHHQEYQGHWQHRQCQHVA